MKTSVAVAIAVAVLAGCECGPGTACKTNADCKVAGTRCETLGGSSGYCTLIPDGGGTGGGSGGGGGGSGATDAGSPLAVISASPIDFGLVPCGKAPVSKDLDITNNGTAPLTFNAMLNGPSVFTMSTTTGTVAAGMTTRLGVNATTPGSATAGAEQTGTLTVTTNDPALARVDVSLKLKASGVTLALSPGIASFGVLPVGVPAPAIPLTLTNSGNIPVAMSVTQPIDTQFALTWDAGTDGGTALIIPPGGSAAGLAAQFTPSKTTPSNGSAVLNVTQAICGAGSVGSVPFIGQGSSGSVGLSTSDVFFGTGGRVKCGTTSTVRTFVLSNAGNAPFSWTGTLAKGTSSPFALMPSSGTVPAKAGMIPGSVTLTVSTSAIPTFASTAEEAFGDTLSIVTDAANDGTHPIVLHQTASGAVLSFTPNSVDFGSVPVNNSANAPVSVVNEGNASANVSLTSNNARFTVTPAGLVAVGGSSFGPFTATFAPGTSTTQQNAVVAIATGTDGGDVLCAPLPLALAMTGLGSSGSVSYSPVALDFASVNCGTTALPRTVTFNNSGNQSYTITPTLANGTTSAFGVAMNPPNGVVATDGGTVVITVTPKPIPGTSLVTPNLYGDTLTVTTDVSGDNPHNIPLRETARGSIFGISAGSLAFGTVPVSTTGNSGFTLTNTGNAPGTLRFLPGAPSIFGMPGSVVLSAGASSLENGTFTPPAANPYTDSAQVSAASGTVLCQALPFTTIGLSGTGVLMNVVGVSPASLTFGAGGLVPCGTVAASKFVTITNGSGVALSFTYTLGAGNGTLFTASGPGTLSMGASGMVNITPKLIPATSPIAPDGFADMLSIRAMGGGIDETHVVPLHQTAQGAILTFNPSVLTFKAGLLASQQLNFTVNNTGNVDAPFTLTKGGADPSNYVLNTSAATAPGPGNFSITVTYNSPALGGTSANISLATSVGRCGPIPAALTMTGNP